MTGCGGAGLPAMWVGKGAVGRVMFRVNAGLRRRGGREIPKADEDHMTCSLPSILLCASSGI